MVHSPFRVVSRLLAVGYTVACAGAQAAPLDSPEPPADVVVASGSPSEVVLGWSASRSRAGVQGYEVLRGDTVVATVRDTRARDLE
jgi:hypothetical protein